MVEETVQGPSLPEEKILVSVRLRPLNQKEIARNDVCDWECINDDTIIYRNVLSVSERSVYPNAYTFDRVFGCDSSTRQVYEEGAKEVALSVVSGINASVFAYGQTSSGKTYTMSGITEYAIADIYNYIERHKEREFVLKFCAMEIYNESVRDLLSADSTPLRLLDDPERGTIVEKLTEEPLRDWNHFQELLAVCEAQRQIGETALNETSSRSHQILRLIIESSTRELLGKDNSSMLAATVNFVDLAGSERASQSLSAGARLKEGCHINRSLLTLGTVVRKLSKGRTGHIPFRDSKLTRILQSSLGGNARTSIICTMSPARSHVEQSRNTLLFASCAKEVTINAQVNVVMSDKALVKHLQRELARLESELRSSGIASVTSDTAALLREKDLEIEKLKNEIAKLTQQRDLVQSEVEDLRRLVEDCGHSTVHEHNIYPKLRVRHSWGYETPTSDRPISVDSHCVKIGVSTFDASQYSEGHSGTDYEENAARIPDFDVHSLGSDPSSEISIPILSAGRNSISQDESEECRYDDSEDFCKVVRCIEMEDDCSNLQIASNNAPKCTQEPQWDGPIHLRVKEEDIMHLPAAKYGDGTKPESQGSPNLKENNQLESVPYAFVSLSPEEPFEMLQEKEFSSSRSFKKVIRSRSCKASLMGNLSLSSFEEVEKNHSTLPVEDKDHSGMLERYDRKLCSLDYAAPTTLLSRNGSQKSGDTAAINGLEDQWARVSPHERTIIIEVGSDDKDNSVRIRLDENNQHGDEENCNSVISDDEENCNAAISDDEENSNAAISDDEENSSSCHSISETKIAIDAHQEDQSANPDEAKQLNTITSPAKKVRDIGLDPMQEDPESPDHWQLQFRKIQKEIIELWDACNVSLVHRTYFFLLFKGDPADSIYMEVELRRLSFLKNTFDRGSQTLEGGRTLSAASSLRDLCRERQMLSKKMQKKLSTIDRERLFLTWGIGLDSKNRSLQLAHRLWTRTDDIDHISESASIVAMLVGLVPAEEAPKEMFGLNFAPRGSGRRSNVFRKRVLSLL
ncbi:kinesin-like protein KIN-7F isoform X2 [Punica granatum]|uniref:Kinesin-like protein KIN-7F isoform X2 n=2 Tax=Punica granatum TaxID=22663 RepID=A0A6P8CNP4_PUNGR|nr:kinesin-like protein KIN-7F isoform X2 [Punica granatum]